MPRCLSSADARPRSTTTRSPTARWRAWCRPPSRSAKSGSPTSSGATPRWPSTNRCRCVCAGALDDGGAGDGAAGAGRAPRRAARHLRPRRRHAVRARARSSCDAAAARPVLAGRAGARAGRASSACAGAVETPFALEHDRAVPRRAAAPGAARAPAGADRAPHRLRRLVVVGAGARAWPRCTPRQSATPPLPAPERTFADYALAEAVRPADAGCRQTRPTGWRASPARRRCSTCRPTGRVRRARSFASRARGRTCSTPSWSRRCAGSARAAVPACSRRCWPRFAALLPRLTRAGATW